MNFEQHPLAHILQFFKSIDDAVLQFSVYEYAPQTVLDERTILDLPQGEFDAEWLGNMFGQLKTGEELAFHSTYRKNKQVRHMPMIDLDCAPSEVKEAKNRLSKVLQPKVFAGLNFYDSGRSLHAYGSKPMSNPEWIDFMGRLLLANLPNVKPVVDARWVGHRLMGGFSSLRLSSNSGKYLKMPTKVR